MHIPDGVLPITHCIIYFLLVGPLLAYSLRQVGKSTKAMMKVVFSSPIIFGASLFSFPIILGIRGHFLLIPLVAILYGPHVTFLSTFTALLLQALFFAEGGLTTLGANTFTMGICGGYLPYYIYRALGRLLRKERESLVAGIVGCLGVLSAALACGLVITLGLPAIGLGRTEIDMNEVNFLPYTLILISVLAWFAPIAVLEGIFTASIPRGFGKRLRL